MKAVVGWNSEVRAVHQNVIGTPISGCRDSKDRIAKERMCFSGDMKLVLRLSWDSISADIQINQPVRRETAQDKAKILACRYRDAEVVGTASGCKGPVKRSTVRGQWSHTQRQGPE